MATDFTALIPIEDEDEDEDFEEETEISEMSFPIPDGFVAPEDVPDGSAFEAHVTVRVQDGRLIIDSINNSKVTTTDEEEVMEEEMSSDQALSAAMTQSGYDPMRMP